MTLTGPHALDRAALCSREVTCRDDTLTYNYDGLNRLCTNTIGTTAIHCTAASGGPTSMAGYLRVFLHVLRAAALMGFFASVIITLIVLLD